MSFIRGFCLIPSPVSFLTVCPLPKNLTPREKVTAQYVSSTKCLPASCSIVNNDDNNNLIIIIIIIIMIIIIIHLI